MKNSNKRFSISDFSSKIKTREDWNLWNKKHSLVFDKFGSFLPAQSQLLETVYDYFSTSKNIVSVFTAPPASGKTHIISLIAHYFANVGCQTCIVIPNGELKQDFEIEKNKIKSMPKQPDVITFTNYLENKEKYELAIVDEAHNLDSAFNMNRKIVKKFSLKKGDNGFEFVIEKFLKNKHFVVTQLTLEYAKDMLNILTSNAKNRNDINKIKNSLTSWLCFLISTKYECKIKFISANPELRKILPSGILMLFSATPLNVKDLEFYCNIPHNAIDFFTIKAKTPLKSFASFFSISDKMSLEEKTEFSATILSNIKNKSLILVNNTEKCQNWVNVMNKYLKPEHVYSIPSGMNVDNRKDTFEKYNSDPNGMLITSSSVFWEGITIKDLKLVVIPDEPFPEPNVLDVYFGRNCYQQKIIHRRIIQGLGRIGRIPNQKCVGVLMFPYDKIDFVQQISSSKLLEEIPNRI